MNIFLLRVSGKKREFRVQLDKAVGTRGQAGRNVRYVGEFGSSEHRQPLAPNVTKRTFPSISYARLQYGFTVIELLVTISVIALLAALTLPALRAARQKADSVGCLSNLRQLGMSAKLQAEDNGGRFGPYEAALVNVDAESLLASHASTNSKIFKCPSDRRTSPAPADASYEWNSVLDGRMLHNLSNSDKSWLIRDKRRNHKGNQFAVFADNHVGVLNERE